MNSLFAVSSRVPSLHSASTCGKCQCGRGYVRAELEHWDGRVSDTRMTRRDSVSRRTSASSKHLARPGRHAVFSAFSYFTPSSCCPHASDVLASPYSLQFSFCVHLMQFFTLFGRPEQSFHYLGPRFSELPNPCSVSNRI